MGIFSPSRGFRNSENVHEGFSSNFHAYEKHYAQLGQGKNGQRR
jgi:hypothetical protein